MNTGNTHSRDDKENGSHGAVEAVVVGGGIIGLTTALALRMEGFRVRVHSAAYSPNTTSDVAAAIWFPFEAHPRERVLSWSARTYSVFENASRHRVPGVSMLEIVDLFAHNVPDPWWGAAVPEWNRCSPEDLPSGYVDGYKALVPLVESSVYMQFLHAELSHLGVPVSIGFVHDLNALHEPIIVNCTGLGARLLCGDEDMYPIRGVVLRTEKPTLRRSVADDVGPNALAYVIPRSNDCILGGLAERGADSMEITGEEIAGIQRRCAALSPALGLASILEAKVGLRPGRSTVRCEPDSVNPRVIHNYGHGGSGFTVCWGCAEDVVAMARERSAA